VPDTNVLLAAFATRGLCEAVMAVCLERHEIILSDFIVEEVSRNLAGKFKMPRKRTKEILSFLREQGIFVKPADVERDACRDSKDLKILGTAVAGRADCVITGDKDLLVLERFREIAILSPREFYDLLR
jgi:putative PIN family toxin of toxin-antitoxin system